MPRGGKLRRKGRWRERGKQHRLIRFKHSFNWISIVHKLPRFIAKRNIRSDNKTPALKILIYRHFTLYFRMKLLLLLTTLSFGIFCTNLLEFQNDHVIQKLNSNRFLELDYFVTSFVATPTQVRTVGTLWTEQTSVRPEFIRISRILFVQIYIIHNTTVLKLQ